MPFEGKKASLFDLLEDLDYDECLTKAQAIAGVSGKRPAGKMQAYVFIKPHAVRAVHHARRESRAARVAPRRPTASDGTAVGRAGADGSGRRPLPSGAAVGSGRRQRPSAAAVGAAASTARARGWCGSTRCGSRRVVAPCGGVVDARRR